MKLNDPHDGLFLITPELRNKLSLHLLPGVRKHLSYLPSYEQIPDDLIVDFAKESLNDKEFYELILQSDDKLSLKVCSFTETPNNEIMWAHYSDNFRGVCLEFDFTNESILENISKVKYGNTIPRVENFQLADLREAMSTKREAWSYEKEWRILHINNFIQFPSNCLKTIHFGCNSTKEQCDDIVNKCKENELVNVKFKKLKINLDGIDFD
jgi:hypothetical protein